MTTGPTPRVLSGRPALRSLVGRAAQACRRLGGHARGALTRGPLVRAAPVPGAAVRLAARPLAAATRRLASGPALARVRRLAIGTATASAVMAVPPLAVAARARPRFGDAQAARLWHGQVLSAALVIATVALVAVWTSRLSPPTAVRHGGTVRWPRRSAAADAALAGTVGTLVGIGMTGLVHALHPSAGAGLPPGRSAAALLGDAVGVGVRLPWWLVLATALGAPVAAAAVAAALAGQKPRSRTVAPCRRGSAGTVAALAAVAAGWVAELFPTPVAPPVGLWGQVPGSHGLRASLGFALVVVGTVMVLPMVLATVTGPLAARTRRADVLLAARRVADAQPGLGLAAAPLAVIATVAVAARTTAASSPGPDGWFPPARLLPAPVVWLAVSCAVAASLAALTVLTLAWLDEGRTAMTTFRLLGLRPGIAARAAVTQAVLPAVAAVAVGAVTGLVAALPSTFDLRTTSGSAAAGPTLFRLRILGETAVETAAAGVILAAVVAGAASALLAAHAWRDARR